ncbi:MAG: hypothetical protein ACK4SY_07590 [Pyrobaculum sp.]
MSNQTPQTQSQEDYVDMVIRVYNVSYAIDRIAEAIGRYTNIWHVTSLPEACGKDKELCDKLGIYIGQPPREGVVTLDKTRGIYWDPRAMVKNAAILMAEKLRFNFGDVVRGIAYLAFLNAFRTAHLLTHVIRFYHYRSKRKKDFHAGIALQIIRHQLRRMDPGFKLLVALDRRFATWLVRRGKLQ